MIRLRQLFSAACTIPNICHPEQSRAVSEANRPPQSKDLYNADASSGPAGNFRVEVRFFDQHHADVTNDQSREAAEHESPAQLCRLTINAEAKPREDATLGLNQYQ